MKNLIGYSLNDLEHIALNFGEKAFRGRQIYNYIYNPKNKLKSIDDLRNLPAQFRSNLKSEGFILSGLDLKKRSLANDGTLKLLFNTLDGESIESVGIPTDKRLTVCVSSQVGCPMDCKFCATGKEGLKRSLKAGEIIEQIILIQKEMNKKVTNIVFMGMGEPLLNFDAVIESAKIMKHQLAYGLSRKRITISTSGIVPNIKKLYNEIDVSLAVSLHAPDDKLRDEIVPINNKYPISSLIDACKSYLNKYENKRSITIEYILIDGVNDSIQHAKKLTKLLSTISCKINLIPFNGFSGSTYRRPTMKKINLFKDYLMNKGYITTLRITRGDEVDGACGQLVGNLTNSIKGKHLISHKSI